MDIITSGCSFTHAPDSWANYLKTKYKVINVAEGGAGNNMNIRNAMLEIHKNNFTHCVIQISGINRFELIVDEHVQNENAFLVPNKNYTWIKSTGDQNWWQQNKHNFDEFRQAKIVGDSLENYVKYCYSDYDQILKTLTAIVNCQTLCKSKNVKQLYFCWKNEFEQYLDKINSSNELLEWWNQIDFDLFWFYNTYDGLCEWGIDNGYTGALHEDHVNNPAQGWLMINNKKTMIGHPSTECHQAFANEVIEKWLMK
jgi:hypothetical protein